MKRILLAVPNFLLWIVYLFISMEDRLKYEEGKSRNMECTSITHGVFTTTLGFNPTKKPVRNFITWKEFWQQRGFYKK